MSGIKGRQNIWVALAGAVFVGAMALPQVVTAQDVTYSGDVASILQENCQNCHRPGTAAPMSLLTYEDARQWAPMIKEAVTNRVMPPGWYVDRTVGIQDFKNDPSLSDQQIETIVSWVDSGTPLGDSAEEPAPIDWPADYQYWQVSQMTDWGPPDVIIESPPFTVPANGLDQWWMPDTALPEITERKWIRAVETRPADEESGYVFHHANTNLVRFSDSGEQGGGGLSSAAVGKRVDMYPSDAGKLIMPGDRIRYRLHLFPMGQEVVDAKIQLGLWFYPEGEEPKYATDDETGFQSGDSRNHGLPRYTDMLIPPHGYQLMRGIHQLEQNARVHSIRGHMHLRGGYQMMEAIYPDGRQELLNKIDWNHLWHTTHIYEDWAQPLLPKGTIIIATSLLDNTADNPSNPDPDQWVVYNRRSAGEMAHIRFGITWIPDEDFEEMVAERERLLRERDERLATDGG